MAASLGTQSFVLGGKLKPAASITYSPGATLGATVETNNLIPVIGSPPAHLPTQLTYFDSGHLAAISYLCRGPPVGCPAQRSAVQDPCAKRGLRQLAEQSRRAG